jgi:hypothetical protein
MPAMYFRTNVELRQQTTRHDRIDSGSQLLAFMRPLLNFLKKNGALTYNNGKCSQFDGTKAEEYGSHDKTFQMTRRRRSLYWRKCFNGTARWKKRHFQNVSGQKTLHSRLGKPVNRRVLQTYLLYLVRRKQSTWQKSNWKSNKIFKRSRYNW